MQNFFSDNKDLQYYLDDSRLSRILASREKEYTEYKTYPFAPENYIDALDNCRLTLSVVGEIAYETLAPSAREVDRVGCKLENKKVRYAPGTQKALKQFAQADLCGITLPRKYGGLNLPITVYLMAVEIVSRADASLMTLFGLQGIAETICEFASLELKAKYLPKLASGEYTGAMVLTEPEAGSDLQAISLRAVYDENKGCWFLNGVKHFISNGCGDVLLVLARSEETMTGGRGLSLFIYEKDENLMVRRLEDKLGIHGSPTCELQFNNCRADLIGQRKRGLSLYVMPLMNGARLAVGAQSIGIAQEAYNQALQYARQRKQFGKAIIEFAPILEMLTQMRIQIEAARSLLYEASILVDTQHILSRREGVLEEADDKLREIKRYVNLLTPMIKYYASEMCNRVTYDAIQIFGGIGYMRDHNIERLYRDARVTTIYEGTSQLQVIAATGGITSGLFFKYLESKMSASYPESFRSPVNTIIACEGLLKKAAICVKAQNDSRYTEYHARALVDMAVEILMAVLLLKKSLKDRCHFNLSQKFITETSHRVRMLGEKVINSNENPLDECQRVIEQN